MHDKTAYSATIPLIVSGFFAIIARQLQYSVGVKIVDKNEARRRPKQIAV